MKFGLYYLPAFDQRVHIDAATLYEQIIEQVVLGEDLGFEAAWVSEHHFSDYGGDIPNPALFMMALAQHTNRIRIGPHVVNAYGRSPSITGMSHDRTERQRV